MDIDDVDTDVLLTTIDNPYNPHTQWDEWFAWDSMSGYNTPSYLARIVVTSHELSDAEQDQAIYQAMKEIVEMNINGVYVLIGKNDKPRVFV